MAAWLDLISAGGATLPLWLDDTDYSGRLLSGGRVPWLDPTALIAWRRRSVQLLKPSVSVLDVGRLAMAFAARRAAPGTAERAPTAALLALLSHEPLRRHIMEVLRGLRQSLRIPLALTIPAPNIWAAALCGTDRGGSLDIDAEQTDESSVYIADFLRSFAQLGVDAILLIDDAKGRADQLEQVGLYQPVLNVCRHYGWDIGIKILTAPEDDLGLDFVIAPQGARGVDVGAQFWEAGSVPPPVAPGGFRYARVPEDAAPEYVLAKLAALASASGP
jgi:hypothetical protein